MIAWVVRRGVMKLDGVRGKKQVWHLYVRTRVFSEANVLYWRKYLWHCWDFLSPPAVIRRPENCVPLVPLVTPLVARRLRQKQNCVNFLETLTPTLLIILCGYSWKTHNFLESEPISDLKSINSINENESMWVSKSSAIGVEAGSVSGCRGYFAQICPKNFYATSFLPTNFL